MAQTGRSAVDLRHYEGFDETRREQLADDELSIGDYVLDQWGVAAMVIVDAGNAIVNRALGDARVSHALRSAMGCWSIRSIRVRRNFGAESAGSVTFR